MVTTTSASPSSAAQTPAAGMSRGGAVRRIAIMGYPCVGKSSITLKFVFGSCPDYYNITVEDLHTKEYTFQNRPYDLRITDTAGQQEYSLFPRSCHNIDGIVLVYAINDRRSFEIIQTIHDKIVENFGNGFVPLVVVGNKTDLDSLGARTVGREEGQRLARQWHAAFTEICCKSPPPRPTSQPLSSDERSAQQRMENEAERVFAMMLEQIERARGNYREPSKCVVS